MRDATVTVLFFFLLTGFVSAQDDPFLELEAGGGYVVGGGAEDPGPSLGTYDLAVAVWPVRRWGVAYRIVRGPGNDLLKPPIEGGDRLFLGSGRLNYSTVTVRYRRPTPKSTFTEIGFGIMKGGQFADLMYIKALERQVEAETHFSGFALEGFVGRRLTRFLRLKSGITYDFNFETGNFQPVVLASFGF
jgi:hypothetical protein